MTCTNNVIADKLFVLHENSDKFCCHLIAIISGVCVFAAGMFTNIYSDHILRNLRKPGETGYKIPKGKITKDMIL